jgi:hypothetical protein
MTRFVVLLGLALVILTLATAGWAVNVLRTCRRAATSVASR